MPVAGSRTNMSLFEGVFDMEMVNTRKILRKASGVANKMRVVVTQEDIDAAEANCPSKCAIARSLIRMGLEDPRVGVSGDGYLAFTKGDKRHVYRDMPQSAVTATYAVDAGVKPKPFSFWLNFGHTHDIVSWLRPRYAGGERRGARSAPRADKGLPQGRTTRRQKLQAALDAVKE